MDHHQRALQRSELERRHKCSAIKSLSSTIYLLRTDYEQLQTPTQTESERSLLPTAQQQYGQLGLGELPFFCFFLKIFGLNFYRDGNNILVFFFFYCVEFV